jgi:tetratricopeptide (TPR) repeat protein
MRCFVATAVLALSVVACDQAPLGAGEMPAPKPSASAEANAPSRPVKATPPTRSQMATTSEAIAVGNLGSQIRGIQKLVEDRKNDFEARAQLIGLLGVRYRYSSDMTDLEQIAEIGEAVVKADPKSPKAYGIRASARTSLHRFQEALADLDEAVKLGAKEKELRAQRASILHALGRYDEALALKEALAKEQPGLPTLASLAILYADMGRYSEAEQKLGEALAKVQNVLPFPMCDILFQWGSLLEKTGETVRAREFLSAAIDRLPGYAHAKAHLARLEGPKKGLEVLGKVDLEKDDPEIVAELAELEASLGHAAEAKKAKQAAEKRYEELGKKHPAAFADHIARFYLVTLPDGKKALAWAEKNLEVRQTPDAYELVVEAALLDKNEKRACEVARTGSKHAYATGAFQLAAAKAFDACKDAKAAEEARSAARKRAVIRR